MRSNSAARAADGLWRQLRPWVIEVLDAALSEPEPASDEEQYIADRAVKQVERHRARLRQPGQGQGMRKAAATRKAQ